MSRLLMILLGVAVLAGAAIAAWWIYDPAVILDREKQLLIWHAESATFQIETRFSKGRFIPAMKSGDRETLAGCFEDGFQATLLEKQSPAIRQVSVVREEFLDQENSSQAQTDVEGLVDRFVSELEPFAEIRSASQRVLEIHPVERGPDDTGTWEIRFLHMFYGSTADGGEISHESEHWVELEYSKRDQLNDAPVIRSWTTLYVRTTVAEHPLLQEVTEEYGLALDENYMEDNWDLAVEFNSQQKLDVAVEDFDQDGYLDIVVASSSKRKQRCLPLLLRNIEGKRFENVTDQYGLRDMTRDTIQSNFSTAWIDYDNDGFPDLLLGDKLFKNQQGRRFLDVTSQSRLEIFPESMGITVADVNNDGLSDLYVLYQMPHSDREREEKMKDEMPWIGDNDHGEENHLWLNQGQGKFRQVLDSTAAGGEGSTFAATWFHLDDDRAADLYIANDFGDNVLLRNKGDGTFEDVTASANVGGFATSMGVASGDINNDGSPELYVGNMYSKMGRRIIAHVTPDDYPEGVFRQLEGACAGNRLYSLANGETRFTEHSVEMGINAVGWGFAPAFVDLDGDGLLDIYANAGYVSFSRAKPDG